MRASRLAAESLRVLPRKRLSRVVGRLSDLKGPPVLVQSAVQAFVHLYDVDLSESEVPPEGWQTFDAFFTRRLKVGARPLDAEESALISPADGRLDDVGSITDDARIRVKGRSYRVATLLGGSGEAARYEGGWFAVVYLAPPDYHRVHAPVSGSVRRVCHVPGTLFPVNRIGVQHVPDLFVRNERVVVQQRIDGGAGDAEVATILVGAVGVGRIGLSFSSLLTNDWGPPGGVRDYAPDVAPVLERGDELGVFHLGSTVIVLATPDAGVTCVREAGLRIRMGEALARPTRSDG